MSVGGARGPLLASAALAILVAAACWVVFSAGPSGPVAPERSRAEVPGPSRPAPGSPSPTGAVRERIGSRPAGDGSSVIRPTAVDPARLTAARRDAAVTVGTARVADPQTPPPVDPAVIARMADSWTERLRDTGADAARARQEVNDALRGGTLEQSRAALLALARAGDDVDVSDFRDALSGVLRSPDAGAVLRAARLLSRVGPSTADVHAVASRATSTDAAVRATVGPQLAALLSGGYDAQTARAVDSAFAALFADSTDVVHWSLVAAREVRLGERSGSVLADVVRRGGPDRLAWEPLARLEHKPRSLVDALAAISESDDAARAAWACEALATGAAAEDAWRVERALLRAAAGADQAQVRVAAIGAMTAARTTATIAELRRLAAQDGHDPAVRRALDAAVQQLD